MNVLGGPWSRDKVEERKKKRGDNMHGYCCVIKLEPWISFGLLSSLLQ